MIDKFEKIKSFLSLSPAARIISRSLKNIEMNGLYMQQNNKKYKDITNSFSCTLCASMLLSAAFILAGCAVPGTPHGEQQAIATKQIPMPDSSAAGISKAQAMEIVEDVLARMHFVIDKEDVDTGYIKTRPLEGAQFFEFWRSDNVGAENWLYGNLHSIRRTVEVNISRSGSEPDIDCNVRIERLSLPERQVTSSARAYMMFSSSTTVIQSLRLHPEQARDMTWIDLGEDSELEREIIKRISSTINREYRETRDEGRTTRDEL